MKSTSFKWSLVSFVTIFVYFMFLHWVSGQEFVRGNNLATDIFFATLAGVGIGLLVFSCTKDK